MDERLRMIALACVALSACGGGDVPTADNVGQKFAEALCAAKARCCQAQGAPLTATEMSNCLLAVADVPSRRSPVPPAQAQFNADLAQQCVQAAARYDCTNGGEIGFACDFVFTGHTAIGQSCSEVTSCEQPPGGHAVCDSGTCVAETFNQGVGAACPHDDTEECDVLNGLWCVPASTATNPTAGVCAQPLRAGDACDYAPCPAGTYCTPLPPMVCAPQQPIGAACDSTAYWSCLPPGRCMNGVCTTDGTCVATDPT